MDGFDAALARYRAFLAAEPITPLLRRSLALLVPGNIRVDTVTADDSLRCTTDGAAVIVGGAAYLLRAILTPATGRPRCACCSRARFSTTAAPTGMSARRSRRTLGRIFMRTMPSRPRPGRCSGTGYSIFWSRRARITFSAAAFRAICCCCASWCYAQLEAAEPDSALEALLCELEAFALTGIPCRDPALSTVRAEVEAAILAPSAAACADIGRRILAALAPELARLCHIADADALARIASQLVDYAFSEADRAEAFGDGCDSRLRLHSEAQDAAHSGPSADGRTQTSTRATARAAAAEIIPSAMAT
ncbi:MAG: hypothetical protein ACLUNO_08450 [Oscillospiraceae bacterium]